MGIKTRLNYGTGAKACSPKCICIFCKRKDDLITPLLLAVLIFSMLLLMTFIKYGTLAFNDICNF